MRSSERPRALGAPQSRKRQARLRRVAALAVSLVASAAVLPAASSAARARTDSHRAGRDGGTGADWNGLDGAASAPAGTPLPYQISDSFNGTSLNSNLWFTDEQSAGTTQGVEGRALQLTASADAASGFHDGILTHCQAVGDFVAEIRFTLLAWPAGDNVSLAVNAPNLANTDVDSVVGGDVFDLFVAPSEGISIPASVHSGELLLSRRGGVFNAYVRSGSPGRWQLIGRLSGSTGNVWVGVAIWNASGPFGAQPVSVQVQSFKLDAQGLSC